MNLNKNVWQIFNACCELLMGGVIIKNDLSIICNASLTTENLLILIRLTINSFF